MDARDQSPDYERYYPPPKRRPEKVPQFQCGPARLKLRNEFNHQEMNVERIMFLYDTSQDDTLEASEFRHLLQDHQSWTKMKRVSDEEMRTLMRVVDRDHNDCIDREEVHHAMKVWYAYVHMSMEVGKVLAHIGDRNMPSVGRLHEALTILNEDQPVSLEEAQWVRDEAFAFGGDERHVDGRQLRMAVAEWYMHVERQATPASTLAVHSAAGVNSKLALENPISRLLRGELPSDPANIAVLGVWFGTCIVMPMAEMWAASILKGHYHFDYWWCSILAKVLRLWGVMVMVQTLLMIALTAAYERQWEQATRLLGAALGIVTLVLLILWILGTFETLTSPPSMCGLALWNFSYLAWILVPALVLFFLLCGLPCLYCSEFMHNRQADTTLMERQNGIGE